MLAAASPSDNMRGFMGSKSSPKKAAIRVVPDDLDASIREAIQRAPGSTSAQLVKVLPASYRRFGKEVRAAAERLAGAGALCSHLKGKTALFFPADPMLALDAAIPPRLTGRTLDKDELKRLVEEAAPGHGVVLDAWLKRALARRALYEHAPQVEGSKKKRFGREPDVRKLVAPLLTALRRARDSIDAKGIPSQRLVDVVLEELGVSIERIRGSALGNAHVGAVDNGDARTEFLAALTALGAENPRQALLSVRELRSRVVLGKAQFDTLALELMRDGAISLHHHDHPAALPEPERQQLVQDARGTYYVGIAPRRGP